MNDLGTYARLTNPSEALAGDDYGGSVCGSALDQAALRVALGGRVAALDVVDSTGSTNADLLVAARAGAPDRTVLVAERQDRGRGRLGRTWVSPPGAGLTFSVLLRPAGVSATRLGWLPLLAGLSVVRTVQDVTSLDAAPMPRDVVPMPLDAVLKWPNDMLLGPAQAKCAGILAETEPTAAGGPAVVVGIGVNVGTRVVELPEGATSLRAEGIQVGRAELLIGLLRRLLADEADWRAADGDPDATGLREAYQRACATLGREVRVSLPDGSPVTATAWKIDPDGRLVLRERSGATRLVAAGDVLHLRALPS